MSQRLQVVTTSLKQAFSELRVNRLRTFLSLLGITIGIFCIIAVQTVVDSLKNNIQMEMSSLGSDVIYLNRWPWMDEGGEYKWWEFWRRPSMTIRELRAIEKYAPDAAFATLCLSNGVTVKHRDLELEDITAYAVTHSFDKIQNIDIETGRYLSASEIDGGSNTVVIGSEVSNSLFQGSVSPVGQTINFNGRKFVVVGVTRKVGKNMAGFDFDHSMVYSYNAAAHILDVSSLGYDPFIIVKAAQGKSMVEMKYEVEGALRRERKLRPGEPNNFAMNQLNQITERLDILFGFINLVGFVIAAFSLIVGAFGIANIMFVTVKERTKVIGLKKAIGAKKASILTEFLLEAVALCIMGGAIGVTIVFLLSLLMTYGLDFPVQVSMIRVIQGLLISGIVGVLAGIIPAWSASRLDPVVAIRSH